ncbi:AVN_HP_G0119630.mRNA.1.CDS.1 [Saccharomyces cerevisiae]|nr:AVN_HP_G0119630.mRNA.1.CDS.1 [Saccharomyces cerevisiae]CAI6996764.1 AVN_HP_G0119630.mRNA.1.CDS.1 [Saccharomyces cerevisiae]
MMAYGNAKARHLLEKYQLYHWRQKLINDASGYISSGLTALMGESGAGKTTLLNVLSQRTESGVVTGELLIDGQPLTNIDAFRRSIGFVQQQDVHLELLTVRESLEISCVLRGDGDRDYLGVVSNLLRLPSEKLVADLSPTQRKLLSIGVELVTKPSLYFDNIYLLKRGGECVYFGSLPNACDYFVAHDRRLTFDREMDNPADFVIDVVGSGSTNIPMDDAEKPTSSKIDEPVSYHKQSDSINWAEL